METQVKFKRQFDEYTLFLLLEEERCSKLKQIDQRGFDKKKPVQDATKQDTRFPNVPARYQGLGITIDWLVSRLNNPRCPLPTKDSARSSNWNTLDRPSRAFLQDAVAILRDLLGEPQSVVRKLPSQKPTSKNFAATSLFSSSSTLNERLASSPPLRLPAQSSNNETNNPPRRPKNLFQAYVWAYASALKKSDDSNQQTTCREVDVSEYASASNRSDVANQEAPGRKDGASDYRASAPSRKSGDSNQQTVFKEVDMSNDEIMDVWKKAHRKEE